MLVDCGNSHAKAGRRCCSSSTTATNGYTWHCRISAATSDGIAYYARAYERVLRNRWGLREVGSKTRSWIVKGNTSCISYKSNNDAWRKANYVKKGRGLVNIIAS